jgi:hypothetical protein
MKSNNVVSRVRKLSEKNELALSISLTPDGHLTFNHPLHQCTAEKFWIYWNGDVFIRQNDQFSCLGALPEDRRTFILVDGLASLYSTESGGLMAFAVGTLIPEDDVFFALIQCRDTIFFCARAGAVSQMAHLNITPYSSENSNFLMSNLYTLLTEYDMDAAEFMGACCDIPVVANCMDGTVIGGRNND